MAVEEFTATAGIVIRFVNFKECVETSEMGKWELSQFEALKKQMETSLEKKQKEVNALGEKLNEANYLDSLSAAAETDLKRKLRALNQEFGTMQQEYFQGLQQTQFKMMQRMHEAVTAASNHIAELEGIHMILKEDACFHGTDKLNITSKVIAELNKSFKKEIK